MGIALYYPALTDRGGDPDKVHAVRCVAGGTALNEILERATSTVTLKALIYIGDCFEEDANDALKLAKQLKLRGVRCFLFHDRSSMAQRYDVDTAVRYSGRLPELRVERSCPLMSRHRSW